MEKGTHILYCILLWLEVLKARSRFDIQFGDEPSRQKKEEEGEGEGRLDTYSDFAKEDRIYDRMHAEMTW